MTHIYRLFRGGMATGALALGAAGCDLDVSNPGIIDAATFDPSADAATLAFSAQQIFFGAFQGVIQSGGLLSEELWTGAVRIETNDISRRALTPVNLDVNSTVFAPLSRAFVVNDDVVATLSTGPNAATDLNLARASMAAGFALVLQAEHMCEGVIRRSRALTTVEVLDSAIVRFQRAITVATAAGGAAIVTASNVGLAHAYLQKKDYTNAATTAALVPSSAANYNVVTVDDLANRGLGNAIYNSSIGNTQSVPQRYQITDSRVPWVLTTQPPQDPTLGPLVRQQKYLTYNAPVRIASYLEARYILAEAELLKPTPNPAPAIALIAERSSPTVAGAGATPLAATTTLGQLMELRAREFWLEGKKLGDIRRNPTAIAYYDAPGTPYYKGTGLFGSDVCFPIPQEEINTNPNIP